MTEQTEDSGRSGLSRRRLLGLASGAVLAGLAGCSGDDGDGGDDGTTEPTETGTATSTATTTPTETATPTATPTPTPDPWTDLFNGEDIEDWTPKFSGEDLGVNHKNAYRVEDGILTVSYDDHADASEVEFGHLFYDGDYLDGTFSHYALRIEYRFHNGPFPPEMTEDNKANYRGAFLNSGVMLHGPRAENATDYTPEFPNYPASLEMQFLGQREDDDDERPTANLCTPSTQVALEDGGPMSSQHCVNSSSDTYRGDQWVTATAVVRGNDQIRHYVEGEEVLSYYDPQLNDGTPLSEGTISIQAEGSPIQFRTVELRPIPSAAPLGEGYTPGA